MLITIELNENMIKIKSDSGKKIVRIATGDEFSEVVDKKENLNKYEEANNE